MDTYFFIGRVTLDNVKSIITKANYKCADYSYEPMLGDGGFKADGATVMSTTTLRNAARQLNIKVEISSPAVGAVAQNLTSSHYQLTFTMDPDTVQKLEGYQLVVFKGVQGPNPGGKSAVPLAWFVSDDFGLQTTISWEENYSAYTSTGQIVPDGTITASNPVPIDFGQVYNVDNSGTGTVTGDGQQNAISVQNTSTREFVCGIAQKPAGSTVPQAICAFTLHGNMLDVMIPEEKIFMMFVSGTVHVGKVFEKSIGAGLLVDLTGVTSRDGISFHINGGWEWGGYSWAKSYAASAQLVPLLIDSASPNSKRRTVALALAA